MTFWAIKKHVRAMSLAEMSMLGWMSNNTLKVEMKQVHCKKLEVDPSEDEMREIFWIYAIITDLSAS